MDDGARICYINTDEQPKPKQKEKRNPIISVIAFVFTFILGVFVITLFDWFMIICMGTDMGWVYKPVSFLINYLSWPISLFFAYLLSYAFGNHKTATNICAIIICAIMVGFTSIAIFVSEFFYIPMYLICIAVLSFLMWATITNQLQ